MLKNAIEKVVPDKDLAEPLAFVLKVALVYALWRVFKYYGETYPGFLWGAWAWLYNMMGLSLAWVNSFLLSVLGFEHTHEGRVIIIKGTRGLLFNDLCLGIAPMFIYSGIILSVGDNWKARLWFIPMGVIIIYFINVFRLLALLLIQARAQSWFGLAHDYLYVAITYSLIFVLIVWWFNRWAFVKKS